MPSLNLSSIFFLKRHTQNYYLNSLRKRMGGWEVYPTAFLKLPQNWVIYIEKGGSNNFAQASTILGNLYCKYCQLIKKMLMKYLTLKFFLGSNLNFAFRVFTWGIANDVDICKKI